MLGPSSTDGGRGADKPDSVPDERVAPIHLGRSLPAGSSSLPGSSSHVRNRGWHPSAPLFGLAPHGVCRAPTVTGRAVGSYPTVSPFPDGGHRVVCFLLHFPSRCRGWALPSVLPPGVRTFLTAKNRGAGAWPLCRRSHSTSVVCHAVSVGPGRVHRAAARGQRRYPAPQPHAAPAPVAPPAPAPP